MQGCLVAAGGVLEVDNASFARLGGVLEEEAVKGGGQAVIGRAALADLDIGDTVGTQQLQTERAIQGRAGDNGATDMAGGLAEIAGLEIDEVDLAGRGPGYGGRAGHRGQRGILMRDRYRGRERATLRVGMAA